MHHLRTIISVSLLLGTQFVHRSVHLCKPWQTGCLAWHGRKQTFNWGQVCTAKDAATVSLLAFTCKQTSGSQRRQFNFTAVMWLDVTAFDKRTVKTCTHHVVWKNLRTETCRVTQTVMRDMVIHSVLSFADYRVSRTLSRGTCISVSVCVSVRERERLGGIWGLLQLALNTTGITFQCSFPSLFASDLDLLVIKTNK